MAIFQNASYSDPVRALTLKALQERQAAQARAQAAQTAPTSMPSPWQGLAHVAGSIGDAMQSARTENAIAGQRQDLAQILSGIDPTKGATDQQVAQALAIDPDNVGKALMEQAIQARRDAATREHARTMQEDSQAHAVQTADTLARTQAAAAAERARVEAEAAEKLAAATKQQKQAEAEEKRRENSPEMLAEKKLATEKAEADAKFLQTYKANRRSGLDALRLVEEAEAHPGLKEAVGFTGGINRMIPGSRAADYMSRHEQIQGQAFLEAYKNLRGAGAITDVEGQKATQAIARMKVSTSEPEYRKALSELKEVVREGVIEHKQKGRSLKADTDPTDVNKAEVGDVVEGHIYIGGPRNKATSWRAM